jgi:hypothetical protein
MKIGQTYFSGYLFLRRQLTTTPLGAGNPAALSVTFHPSTKSFSSSASLKNLRVGTNSFSIFMERYLFGKEGEVKVKKLLRSSTIM